MMTHVGAPPLSPYFDDNSFHPRKESKYYIDIIFKCFVFVSSLHHGTTVEGCFAKEAPLWQHSGTLEQCYCYDWMNVYVQSECYAIFSPTDRGDKWGKHAQMNVLFHPYLSVSEIITEAVSKCSSRHVAAWAQLSPFRLSELQQPAALTEAKLNTGYHEKVWFFFFSNNQ